MITTIHIPNGAEEITAVYLTKVLREGGVIEVETAVHIISDISRTICYNLSKRPRTVAGAWSDPKGVKQCLIRKISIAYKLLSMS